MILKGVIKKANALLLVHKRIHTYVTLTEFIYRTRNSIQKFQLNNFLKIVYCWMFLISCEFVVLFRKLSLPSRLRPHVKQPYQHWTVITYFKRHWTIVVHSVTFSVQIPLRCSVLSKSAVTNIIFIFKLTVLFCFRPNLKTCSMRTYYRWRR